MSLFEPLVKTDSLYEEPQSFFRLTRP